MIAPPAFEILIDPLFRLLFFFDRYNFTTLIMTAVRANRVRRAHLAAVRARDQVHCHQGIVRATAVAAATRMLSFWLRNHDSLLISFTITNEQSDNKACYF